MRYRSAALAMLALAAVGCSDDISIPDGAGLLRTTITLESSHGTPASGELQLFLSPDQFENGNPSWTSALTGGPTKWDGEVLLGHGTYYLRACFDFGCGDHRTIEGEPAPVEMVDGEITEVELSF